MVQIHLKGIVTAEGLQVELPPSLELGQEVEISLQLPLEVESAADDIAPTYTEEEVAAMMEAYRNHKPRSPEEWKAFFAEMGETGWEHITDAEEWVAEQRRKSYERSKW